MLRFLESFDHYTAGWASVFGKWQDGGNAFGNSGFGAGRTGNAWLNSDSDRSIFRDFTDEDTWILGFAFYKAGVLGHIAGWYDPIAGDWQATLAMDGLGRLVLRQGFLGGTVLGTGPTSMASGTYNYVEWKLEIGNAADSEVRLNGEVEINVTGVDTQNTANAFARRLYLGGFNGGLGSRHYDDVYLLDDVDSGVVGAPNNDFWGDTRVECEFADGNGNSSQLVGSDADSTDNYLLVDEATPDSDTTYVEGGTPDKDTYAYSNLTPSAGTVHGMQIIPLARKTDAGTRKICSVTRLGTSEQDSADKILTSGYVYLPDCRDGDPDGDQWTITSVNAMEAGVKVTA